MKMENVGVLLAVILFVGYAVFLSVVAYVAIHFISKFW